MAQSLVTTNILDYIQLTPDYRIVEMEAIEAWENKSLKELDIRARYGISVLAIKQGEQIDISPAGEDVIKSEDILVVLGRVQDIEKFQEKSNARSKRK